MAGASSKLPTPDVPVDYAVGVASQSYAWYRRAAIKARRFHRLSEVLNLLISAAIPICVVIAPANTKVPAVLGALIVVISGLRSVFHWHDDYVRFSAAREAVEGERRLYGTASGPYADEATRDQTLVRRITQIEREEMAVWIDLIAQNSGSKNSSA